MKKLTLAKVIKFLPKNTIIVNEVFYNEETNTSGALVFHLLKNKKYKELLKKRVISMKPILYKSKIGLSVTLK